MRTAFLVCLLSLGLTTCGGEEERSRESSSIQVFLTDAPATYDEVWVTVADISVHRSGGTWTGIALTSQSLDTNGDGADDVVPDPDGSVKVDLLALRGVETLFASGKIDPGHYTQLRLRVTAGEIVEGGQTIPMEVPSGVQTGIKLICPFMATPGDRVSVLLDFDAVESIVDRGSSGKPPLLKPVIKIHIGERPLLCSGTWSVEGRSQLFGESVASAGDVNGDGFDDVIVGGSHHYASYEQAGRACVYLGGPAGPSTAPDWESSGDQTERGRFGKSVASAGDVNGDGYADVIIGAPGFTTARVFEGKAHLFLGGAQGLSAAAAWESHGDDQVNAHFGCSVASAGDVNGDGLDDVIIGAYGFNTGNRYAGKAYLFLGESSGLSQTAAWETSGDDRFLAEFGVCVASAGDVDGDGYGDVIVGAARQGKAFVYRGEPSGRSLVRAWTSTGDGQPHDNFGWHVASAGDVNGDGYSDILVGAHNFNTANIYAGKAYLYLGRAGGLSGSPSWVSSGDDQAGAYYGGSVASAGDVNGDGFSDILIGSHGFSTQNWNAGKVFLYLGSPGGPSVTAAWESSGDDEPPVWFGYSAASAGDVNGDGYSDIIVGAPIRYPGKAFVYFACP